MGIDIKGCLELWDDFHGIWAGATVRGRDVDEKITCRDYDFFTLLNDVKNVAVTDPEYRTPIGCHSFSDNELTYPYTNDLSFLFKHMLQENAGCDFGHGWVLLRQIQEWLEKHPDDLLSPKLQEIEQQMCDFADAFYIPGKDIRTRFCFFFVE